MASHPVLFINSFVNLRGPEVLAMSVSVEVYMLLMHLNVLEVRMDKRALKFHKTKDLKISDEIHWLAGKHSKLKEAWKFVVI